VGKSPFYPSFCLCSKDVNVIGSNVVSTSGTAIVAGGDVNIVAASDKADSTHVRNEVTSGLFSGGGFGVTIGKQEMDNKNRTISSTAVSSTVGSTEGNVLISAGNAYQQIGSNVLAPTGDIDIVAKQISVLAAMDSERNTQDMLFKQSGLTLQITSPVLSAIQTVQQMKKAAEKTSDGRMQVLAGAAAGLAAMNGYAAIKNGEGQTVYTRDAEGNIIDKKEGQIVTGEKADGNPESRDANAADKVGGVNLAISLGASKNESHAESNAVTARSSTIAAGGNVNLIAQGGGAASNIVIQGGDIKAGVNATLKAENEVRLLAAQSTTEQHSSNKGMSASVGVSIGTDGLLFSAGASGSRGRGDGNDVTQVNTHVDAGNKLTISSGTDTTLRGAVVRADQVVMDVGTSGSGNLNIESLQDTSTYQGKQQSLGVSVSVGAGKMSGSLNYSSSRTNSNYASVTEQSGVQAGDGGFQINVAGNTDLKGARIASSAQAESSGKNILNTETITTSDIQNHAFAEASTSGIGLSTDMMSQGKYGAAKAAISNLMNNGSESGSSSGTTRSAVGTASVTVGNSEKQQALTGQTAEQAVASLNRDTANSHTAAVKQDVQALQEKVEAERTIKNEFFRQITIDTDAAYKSMFKKEARFYKVTCSASPQECLKNPGLVAIKEISSEEAKRDGSVLAVNGILNEKDRAGQLAYQNAPVDASGNKPAEISLMHIAPAATTLAEVIVAGYEKILSPILGYTNADFTYADLLQGRGTLDTLALGHSRGTIVQRNSFNIAADNGYVNGNLVVAGVGGGVGVQDYTDAATRVVTPEKKNNVTYTYMANDPIPVIAAGNSGDALAALKEFYNVIVSSNSAHSCYGTGAPECSTIANPVPNGVAPSNQQPDLIRTYKGGVLTMPSTSRATP